MNRLNHNTRVLVTDGGRAQVFRNAGQIGQPDLRPVKSYGNDTPPTRELGTDKPARVNSLGGDRSSIDATDYHQQAEDRFIQQMAADMDADLKAGEFDGTGRGGTARGPGRLSQGRLRATPEGDAAGDQQGPDEAQRGGRRGHRRQGA